MDEPTLEALNAQFAIPGQVMFQPGPGGLGQIVIQNAAATATIALQGGQVLTFQPQGQAPVLFLSTHASYAPGKAVRGGIPVCWPWFGPHPTDPAQPQHGFARTLLWTVQGTAAPAGGPTEVRLGLVDTPATRARWPYPFALTLTVQVGRDLRLTLEFTNSGSQPMPITEALHAYLQIGEVARVSVQGLDGTAYVDKVAGGQRAVQSGPVTIRGETDSVYLHTTTPCVVEDQVLGRQIEITKEGSQSTVIWNPGPAKAAQLADLGAEEYAQMLCVEAGNALDDALTLDPGATHRLTLRLAVAPLGAH